MIFSEATFIKIESDGDILLAIFHGKGSSSKLILYYGHTYHISPHQDLFATYDHVDSSVVNMGMMPNVRLLESILFRSRLMMVLSGP